MPVWHLPTAQHVTHWYPWYKIRTTTQKFLSKCKTNHVKKALGNACRKLGGSRATFIGYAATRFPGLRIHSEVAVVFPQAHSANELAHDNGPQRSQCVRHPCPSGRVTPARGKGRRSHSCTFPKLVVSAAARRSAYTCAKPPSTNNSAPET